MKPITVSEFRRNIKKYADITGVEKVIVNHDEGKASTIVTIDELDGGYSPEFVKKIFEAEISINKGNFIEIKNFNNIWEDIL